MATLFLNRSRQAPAEEPPATAALAERFRRAGDLDRAIALCRDGLKKFPTLLSARVTLGWALLDKGQYDDARVELEHVLRRAPDNLAAIRGLAELHERAESTMSSLDSHAHWQEHQEETQALMAHIADVELALAAEEVVDTAAAEGEVPVLPEFTNSAGMAMAPAVFKMEAADALVPFSVDAAVPAAFLPDEDVAPPADPFRVDFEAGAPAESGAMPPVAVEDIDFDTATGERVSLDQLASAFEDASRAAPSLGLVAEALLVRDTSAPAMLEAVIPLETLDESADLPIPVDEAPAVAASPLVPAASVEVTSLPSRLDEEAPPTLEIMAAVSGADEVASLAPVPAERSARPATPAVGLRALRVAALERLLRKVQRRRMHLEIGSVA